MYLLGHAASGMLLGHYFNRMYKERNSISSLLGAFGVIIPDLIDKPIGSMIFDTGRWVGHTFLFISLFGILLYKFREKWMGEINKRISPYTLPSFSPYLLWASMYLHLLGDLPSITMSVVFWPAFGSFPKGKRASFLLGLLDAQTQVGEIFGLFLFIVWGLHDKWGQKQWMIFCSFVGIYTMMLIIAVVIFGFPS